MSANRLSYNPVDPSFLKPQVDTLLFSRLFSFFKAKLFQLKLFKSKPLTAAQAWQKTGGEAKHAYWLFAWPVHMLLGRDSLFLTEPAPLSLSVDESLSLVASLNAHFEAHALYFYFQPAYQPAGAWFLGLDADPKITTQPLAIVKNKDIAPFLPVGEGALAWANIQNEIQMLLFDHPVNMQREQAGLPAVNSLWCDGLSQWVEKAYQVETA